MDRINDFAFKIATANGTGSASANGLIMQAIFRMGVPVTGKNVFPSNIQGLPTWYEIRVSRHGYTARTPHFDLLVAMNPATYDKDVADWNAAYHAIVDAMLRVFARYQSLSVQQTLYSMGEAAIDACPAIRVIHLEAPNQHRIPVNLQPFGLENRNEIFVTMSEPYGLIKATLERELAES